MMMNLLGNILNGDVVGMIEVIQSDFARFEPVTRAAEAEAQKQYDEFMGGSCICKTRESNDIEQELSRELIGVAKLGSHFCLNTLDISEILKVRLPTNTTTMPHLVVSGM